MLDARNLRGGGEERRTNLSSGDDCSGSHWSVTSSHLPSGSSRMRQNNQQPNHKQVLDRSAVASHSSIDLEWETAQGMPGLLMEISQASFLCNICVVLRPNVTFGKLLFIHASTNATDDHKYSPLPSADFDSSEVLVSFSAFIFS